MKESILTASVSKSGVYRSPERIKHHYNVEKRLAAQLKAASKSKRKLLYSELYNELFRLVPDHPQLTKREDPEARRRKVLNQLALIKPSLSSDVTFLEVGGGDGALALAAAELVKMAYMAEVSEEVCKRDDKPDNYQTILSDGASISLPDESIDLTYSYQLIEHLHPDDVLEHLQEIFRILKKGGEYYCVTPSRLSGPHDVTGYFDQEAGGFHLQEFTNRDLSRLFYNTGFKEVNSYIGGKGFYRVFPLWIKLLVESSLGVLPRLYQCKIARTKLFRPLVNVILAGKK